MKALILIILFLMLTFPGFCDNYSLLLMNPEDAPFYYVLDPPELSGLDPADAVFIGRLYEYFTEDSESAGQTFKALLPGDVRKIEEVPAGFHLLVGFFALEGEKEYPVRVLRLQSGGGIEERFYTIYKEPSLIVIRTGIGRLKRFSSERFAAEAERVPARLAIRIDNNYEDWENIPYLTVFSADFHPASFTRERSGKVFEVLPLRFAQYWDQGGTHLNEIKTAVDIEHLYLFCSTHSGINDNLSIFLYFHGERASESENRVTLEILPSSIEPGLVVLWEKEKAPIVIGSVASGRFFIEAEIDKTELYRALGPDLGARPSLDITTSYFDRASGVYEEFFFTTLFLDDIPSGISFRH